jgi:two-component system response regulator NreC
MLALALKEKSVRLPAEIPEAIKMRCAVVHDHVLLRQGLKRLLEDEPDIEVVAEAGSAREALQKVAMHQPEVVITDAHIFECEDDEAESMIRRQSPHSGVVFVMAHEETEPRPAKRRKSCALRQTSSEELVAMVREAAAASRTGQGELEGKREVQMAGLLPVKRELTAREREVLKLLAEGRTVRSAAGVLGVSAKTVDAHKFNLMRKLGIHNKAELVMCAIQQRVVKVPARL